MSLTDCSRFKVRFTILLALLAVPLFRLLIQHEYGFFHPEIPALGLLVLLPCFAAALIVRNARWFYGLVLLIIVVQSVHSVRVEFLPDVRLRWIVLAIVTLTGTAMVLMKARFFPVLLAFVLGMFLVDVCRGPAQVFLGRHRSTQASRKPKCIVYIVLDGMLGLRGFPADIPGNAQAGEDLQRTLEKHGFTVYPFAFSNYRTTWDSVPSILNNQLLESTGEHLNRSGPKSYLKQNLLFRRYLNEGYALRVYQSDYINFGWRQYGPPFIRSYNANSLAAMHSVSTDWPARLRQILTIYLQTDELWWNNFQALVPPRFHPQALRIGPLAIRGVWPSVLAEDIKSAGRDTLFFAHLLTPHCPYVYRPDGTIRDPSEWLEQKSLDLYDDSEYRHWCQNYAEQVQFLARQLDAFLGDLRASGTYDDMTVIIHGDHGSRLRLFDEERRSERTARLAVGPARDRESRYEFYLSPPTTRDLLSSFSVLLAIKPEGAIRPGAVQVKGSVLYFLRQFLWQENVPDEEAEKLNSVYLFDARGLPRKIPFASMWRAEEQKRRNNEGI